MKEELMIVETNVIKAITEEGLVFIKKGKEIQYYQNGDKQYEKGGIEILCRKKDVEDILKNIY